MKKTLMVVMAVTLLTPGMAASQAATWQPKRINKVIELLESGQAVYYQQIAEYGYEECQAVAKTEADYISINMEHSYVDVRALRQCMQGLVDAGPTRSGHRTPAVVAVLPAMGWTEEAMRGNTWTIQQVMGSGVHGLLLTHATDPAAVRLMIEAIRYPFAPHVPGLGQGMQGNGSQGFPASIWGIPPAEYVRKADPWPMNPNGEFFIGLKVENTHAQVSVDQLVRMPGIAFVEHGPGDTGFWYGGPGVSENRQAELTAVEERVFAATKEAGKYFLHSCADLTWLDRGARVCTNANTAAAGRAHLRRQMPW